MHNLVDNNFDNLFLFLYNTYECWNMNNNYKQLIERLSNKLQKMYPHHDQKFIQSFSLTLLFNFL